MRIIAGKFKGTKLYLPTNKKIRPLKDMVKESIFNFLVHSNKILFQIEKSNILDLYSGTGSFGLECASREAGKVIFIEKEKEAIKILKQNIKKLKMKDEAKIFYDDVFNLIKKHDNTTFGWLSGIKFDLIFCDPPFKDSNINDLVESIIAKDMLKKNGIIILHMHKNNREKLTSRFKVIDKRVYGLSKITFGEPLIS